MTFTVKYRAKNGAIAEEVIEATDRGDCFAKCKARGIAVVNVADSGQGSKDPGKHCPTRPARLTRPNGRIPGAKLLISIAAIAIAGICIWLWNGQDTAKPEKAPVKNTEKTKVKKSKSKSDVSVTNSSQPKEAEKLVLQEEKKKPAYDPNFQANYPRKPGHLPLPGGNVITFKPPAPGCTAQVFTVNGLYLCDAEGNFTKYEPPRLFDNRFENTLDNLAMNTQILLTDHTKNFTDEEINKYLSRPITIEADDPPDVVLRKTATAAMKDDIREFIKEGGTYGEYVDSLHNKIGTERVLHREAMREMVTLLSEGDYEGAREYREKIDSFLSESGYLGLKLPAEWQRQLDENTVPVQQEQ